MTELLYQTDSYLRLFDARIARVDADRRAVVLDRSAFYPGGGGQPNDSGTLTVAGALLRVEKVKKEGDEALHFIAGGSPLPQPGDECEGAIDWEKRYALMRTHTALHVLCGTVFRNYGAQVTGGDMEPLKGRMDFEFATMRAELVHEIEAAVNHEIAQGREIRVQILPPQLTLDTTEDFSDGVANLFTGYSNGTWSVNGGRYSALHRELVKTGLATSAFGFVSFRRDPSLIIFGAEMPPATRRSDVLQPMLHALETERRFSDVDIAIDFHGAISPATAKLLMSESQPSQVSATTGR